MTPAEKVVFITGVSSGFGEEVFKHFSKRGYDVVGTSRKASTKVGSGKSRDVKMDLLVDASTRNAVDYTVESFEKIDVLINSAGMHLAGALEDTSIEEAKLLLETNLLGTVKLIKAVLPVIRTQGSGHIVNISSLGGVFGIKVTLVEPGDFRTGVVKNRVIAKKSGESSPYRENFEKALGIIEKGGNSGEEPFRIAYLIERIIHAKNPKLRYRIGKRHELIGAVLRALVPDRLFERMMMNHYGL